MCGVVYKTQTDFTTNYIDVIHRQIRIMKMNKEIKCFYAIESLEKYSDNKKQYNTPKISNMGSMQKITLGGSQTFGDSGQVPPLVNV